jgi:hypothetical protein
MTQEDALLGLQSHPEFKPGSTISGVRRRGDRWVISIIEPKEAALPFEKEEKEMPEMPELPDMLDMDMDKEEKKDDEGSIDKPAEHEDKPEPPKHDEESHEKSELSELKELVKDVKKIIDALGINSEEPKAPGMDDAPAPKPPVPPAPPAPKPPKPEKDKEVTLNKSMHPGEAPPGTVNVGSPAFASTKKVASFTATSDDTFGSIKEAKASLDAEFGPQGYKVKQLRRSEGKIYALMSVR